MNKKTLRTMSFWKDCLTQYQPSYINSTNWRSEMIAKIIAQNDVESVLEIGCGCGNVLEKIKNTCNQVVKISGIDINQQAINLAQEKIPNGQFFCDDVLECLKKIDDKSFDIVFSSGCLIYICPEDIKKIIFEIKRISKNIILHVEKFGNINTIHQKHRDIGVTTFCTNYVGEYAKLDIKLLKFDLHFFIGNKIKVGEASDLMIGDISGKKIALNYKQIFNDLIKNKKTKID